MRMESADYISGLPRKRMAAGVLFVDDLDRVLLVEPTYKDRWELPGGVVEHEESPFAAAVREVREELGLTIAPGRLLVLDWVPPDPFPSDGVMFVFDGGVLSADQLAAIALPAEELRGWAWCDDDALAERLRDGLARRIVAARRARADGVTVYLEDGYAVAGEHLED
ncbi:NUDIX domain-containing protein [Nocardia sp. NPDC052566]|uniref:NUDIX domain-containing protein n=1 Tax=Nocardia sp. NPDC052566 TaxID=3364330 RepID=UPI0037C710DA